MTHKISLKVSQVGNKTVFYGDRGAEPAPLTLFSPSNNETIPPSGSDTCVTSTACEINYFYRLKKRREKEGRRGRNKGADLFSSHPRYLWEEKNTLWEDSSSEVSWLPTAQPWLWVWRDFLSAQNECAKGPPGDHNKQDLLQAFELPSLLLWNFNPREGLVPALVLRWLFNCRNMFNFPPQAIILPSAL